MKTITLQTTPSTEIHIGKELPIESFIPYKQTAIITDKTVEKLFGGTLLSALEKRGIKAKLYSIPAGEINKTRATKEYIEDQLLADSCDRQTAIIGFGGGVVTDLSGYVASTFQRGVPYIAIPTTLLGMVDAAIGGKNGVNTPWGKNLVGTVYHPSAVLCELTYLDTLPEQERRQGKMEMVKHGLIADRSYYTQLKSSPPLEEAIFRSCMIKKHYIENDPMEKTGLRKALNFGHTVGHAIEALSNFSINHGDAIAIGMVVESYLSWKVGALPKTDFEDILETLTPFLLPLPDNYSPDRLLQLSRLDKKAISGKVHCALLSEIGKCAGSLPIDDSDYLHSLYWLEDVVCHSQRS